MYMHITPEEGSSSSKKKVLAFKASHNKKKKKCQTMIVQESSSDDDIDDASLALMVRKTTKMLKKLNKSGIKFDGKKFFTSSKRKPISEMDCYNCGELGHLAHQCPKPLKDKYKYKNKGKKDDSSDEEEEKKKNKPYKKKDDKKKEYHKKKKRSKAYIIGDWLTDIESSCESSSDKSDNEKEKVAAFVIGSSLSSSTSSPPPSPPSSPSSSTTHLCLMAKSERKVQSNDSDDDSDSDDEFDAPSYDELVKLLNKYTKIIRKTRNENDEIQNENESLSYSLMLPKRLVMSLESKIKLCLLVSRSSKLLTKSLEMNMISLRRSMMSSPLITTC
jgi:hypothetical protein